MTKHITAHDESWTGNGLCITRSQRHAGGAVWWWISNVDPPVNKYEAPTYQQRTLLKRHGARWSRKRNAWYIIRDTLPAAITQLVGGLVTTEAPATAPDLPLTSGYTVVPDGKQLHATTLEDLAGQGLATCLADEDTYTIYRLLNEVLMGTWGSSETVYCEVRTVSPAEKAAVYADFRERATQLLAQTSVLALPEPAADAPTVHVLPDIDDPWG